MYRLEQCRRILFFIVFLMLLNVAAFAVDEKYIAPPLTGANNQIAKDSSCIVQDTVFYNPSLRPLQTTFKVRNLVTFRIDEYSPIYLPDSLNVTITFKVYYSKLVGSTVVLDSSSLQTLFVEYNKFRKYQYSSTYTFNGGYRAEVKIFSVTSNFSSGVFSDYKNILVLENQIDVNREYLFNPLTDVITTISGELGENDSSSCLSEGEYQVYWNKIPNADEYDLEWTYIDSSAIPNYYNVGSSTIDHKRVFNNNASRVSITSESYAIPLLYEHSGSLFYRVRPVRVKQNGQRVEAYWSSFYTNGFGRYDFSGHETRLNWQSSTSFAEDGKRKSVVQYFDGTLRNRQTVTKDNSTCNTVIAESLYDFQGRPVIQVLPAPTINKLIQYTPSFNVDVNGLAYEKTIFDPDTTGSINSCSFFLPGMGTTSGASMYYSSSNSLVNSGYHKYIPDAQLYPFVETRFTPDNTERVAMQGGVGKQFQINLADSSDGNRSHETRYFYGSADQEELDALFGTEVGNSSHYSKNMVRDANGQYSVSYVDMHGRTIATALAGKPKSNMDSLLSSNNKTIVKRLLDSSTNNIIETSIIATKSLIVTRAGFHRFEYNLLPDSLSIMACDSSFICYDCLYDLELTISNDCNNDNGIPIVIRRSNLSLSNLVDTLCNSNVAFPAVDTSINLNEGSYTITKNLTISEIGMNRYREIFMRRNTCKTLQEFINEQQQLLFNNMECYASCQSCRDSLGTWSTYRSKYMIDNNIPVNDTFRFRDQAWLAYKAKQEVCDELCENTGLHTSIRKQMLDDLTSPYGQYANLDSAFDYNNIFFINTTSGIGNPRFKQIPVGTVFFDEQGRPDSIVNSLGVKVPPTDPSITPLDFANNFVPSWAEALLPLHPEYCKLKKFETYAASHQWDERFSKVNTFKMAVDSGFFNPCDFSGLPNYPAFEAPTNSNGLDPFFTSLETSNLPLFKDSLMNYAGSTFNIWSLSSFMASCDSGDTQCFTYYQNINNCLTASDTSCTADKDFIWRIFREMYLTKKTEFIDRIIQSACVDPVLLPWQEQHFPSLLSLINQNTEELSNSNQGEQTLETYINDNCESYVAQWMQEMLPCNLSPTDSMNIIPRLIAVCKAGADQNHIFGSSTTPRSVLSTLGDSSFVQVLKSVLGVRYDTTCNAYLITSPQPYNAQLSYTDIEILDRPDSCQCSKINILHQQYKVSNAASFSSYLLQLTGDSIAQGTLDTLLKACNGEISCQFLPNPVTLPASLQCYTGSTCIDCIEMQNAFIAFRAEFPAIVPTNEETDSVQRNRNRLFESFMNYRFGFSKTTQEYIAFMDTCQVKYIGDSTICDTLIRVLTNYQNQIYNQHVPLLDLSGCDTTSIKAWDFTNGIYPALGEWLQNGIFRIPIGDTLNFNPGLEYDKKICIDSGISISQRLRYIPNDSITIERLKLNSIDTTSNLLATFGFEGIKGFKIEVFRGKDRDTTLSDSLYAYISIGYLPLGYFTYQVTKKITNHYNIASWFNLKTEIRNSVAKIYVNNLLLDSVNLPSHPQYLNFLTTESIGPGLQIDWLKMYDGKNRLRYFEDFLGCGQQANQTMNEVCYEDCAAGFRPYFLEQVGNLFPDYNYSQIDSLYFANCGIHPEPCYQSPMDCNQLQQVVVDYYTSQFNINYDSTGLEKNVWKLGYSYVVRPLTGYSLKDFVQNGILTTPDSVTYVPGDFSYSYQIPMCTGNEFTYETKVRAKPGFNASLMQLINNFFMNNGGAPIVQFTGNSDYDGFQGSYVLNGIDTVQIWDFNQADMHDISFSQWRKLTIAFKSNKLIVHVDDTLRGQVFFPGNFTKLLGFPISGWYGLPIQIDYIKLKDRFGVTKFSEEFTDFTNFAKVPFEFVCPPINCNSNFTSFFNTQFNTAFSYDDIVKLYKKRCNVRFEACGPIDGPTLCGSPDQIFTPTNPPEINSCSDSTLISVVVGTLLYEAYIDSLENIFESRYLAKCLKAKYNESFTVVAPISEFHYTLYYYDQAGNLVKTVPPAGVDVSKFGWAVSYSDSIRNARALNQFKVPAHTLITQYRYNSLNQVVSQNTPDAGYSKFWYDRLGRLVLSQNASQKLNAEENSLYSYTKYDQLGRITEVGQIRNHNGSEPITNVLTRNQSLLNSWVSARTMYRSQITETIYDLPYAGFAGEEHNTIRQRNLRNRVSFSSITDTASMSAFNQATFYSYDIHGNVDTLLQDYGPLTGVRNIMNIQIYNSNRWKRMVYRYDLISGKVNHVAYQPPRGATYYPDMFYHRYEYDAENRLILAETSKDSIYWEKDARYEYFKHGPLARTLIGEQMVQGIDYAYTLQGWLKGVNSISSYGAVNDIGGDGKSGSIHEIVARDAYGFNLNYHSNDFRSINNTVLPFPVAGTYLPSNEHRPLFNGNINSMAVNLKFPNPTSVQTVQLYNYKYDQLNRITGMDVFRGFADSANTWSGLSSTTDYKERVAYDANGNILKYLRNGISGISTNMDSLTYFYYSGSNQLKYVKDNVADNIYTDQSHGVEDINNQTNTSNYTYSEIGNLEKDVKDSIKLIKWNVYGKIVEIQRTASSARPITNIKYTYDAAGNRISKRVVNNQNNIAEYTWYVRDAQGNVLATYFGSGQASTTLFSSNYTLAVTDQHIYGSSRIGLLNRNFDVKTSFVKPSVVTFERGLKVHELTNHLGNVLMTISDKKVQKSLNDSLISHYEAEVITANDYYPFGMIQPGRKYASSSSKYRYSINGQEKDIELNENITTALYWEYDGRIGKRWNVDPKPNISLSPYAAFANNPLINRDPLGDTTIPTVNGQTMELSAGSFTTFDGSIQNLKGSDVKVQPGSGTLKSFTAGTSENPLTFEATFGSVSGKFLGYFNSKNPEQSWESYSTDLRSEAKIISRDIETAQYFDEKGMWDYSLTPDQANRRLIGLAINPSIPGGVIRPLTIANTAHKVLNSPVGRKVADFVNMFKPIDAFDVTKTLYRGTTGSEVGSSVLYLTDDAVVAATYIKNGGQVMSYEMSQFSIQSLKFSGDLRLATGINGPTGAVSTEYIFQGKELVEAVNSLAKPINK